MDNNDIMSDIPRFIEFVSEDIAPSSSCVGDFLSMYSNGLYENEGNEIEMDERGEISNQDLDAMKQMVREVRQNPDLIYQFCSISSALNNDHESFNRAIEAHGKWNQSTQSPDASGVNHLSQLHSSSPGTQATQFVPISPESSRDVWCCQECNSPNSLVSSREQSSTHPMMAGLPSEPLPF